MSPGFEIIDPRFGQVRLVKPDGLAFSPDERILYVSAFDLDCARLRNGRVFAVSEHGLFDGLLNARGVQTP